MIDYYDVLIKYEDNLAPESFNEIIELNDKLNKKSGTLSNSGKLLRCKVFSHMASAIKNRDDDSHGEAERYYQMALKAADDLCSIDESLRFKIQRQCTMFYKDDRATRILKETADYFCRTRNMIEYSRTLLNLSTHRLFMNDTSDEVLSLFNKCEETMTGLNTREISFVYNNRSILHYFRGNYNMAIRDLNEAFKYAASDFTKFTIKSNLFNVSLKLDNGSQQRYMEDVKRISEKYSSDKDSNFMYRLYYLIDQFHFMKSSGSSIDGLEAIIRKIEKYSTSSFFISLLNGLKHSIGMDCIDVDAPYALIDRMNEDRIFLSELLFWE